MPHHKKKAKKRWYHKIDDGAVKEINTKVNVERVPINHIGFRDGKKEPPIRALEANFDVKSNREVPIKSHYDLIRQKELSEIDDDYDLEISLDLDRSDPSLEWKKDEAENLSSHEIAKVLVQIFPNITDNYVLYRHIQARGYDIKDDNTVIQIDGELVEDFTLDDRWAEDIDFIFVEGDYQDKISEVLEAKEELWGRIPTYDRNKKDELGQKINNFNGRSFVLAVLSDSGKIYALRITTQEMNMDHNTNLRLMRIKNIKDDPQILETLRLYRNERRIARGKPKVIGNE